MRRTKIVATLGPATDTPGVMEGLIEAGVDVVRLNFSHATAEEHIRRSAAARAAAGEAGRPLAVLADLQGPKIRTGVIRGDHVVLESGQEFMITTEEIEGDNRRVSTNYSALPAEVGIGHNILLNDGRIRLEVLESGGRQIRTRVIAGGELSDRKAINLPGAALSTPALTDKDLEDLRLAVSELGVEYVALSFVRRAEDIRALKGELAKLESDASTIAKIEKPEALEHIDGIAKELQIGDGLMVARGDLGVECEISKVPALQKRLLSMADRSGLVCITATQMLESMVREPMPSRAEASDVFNAILDGTDAAMLSAETAAGSWPVESVRMMASLACEAERWALDAQAAGRTRADLGEDTFELAICRAAWDAATEAGAKAVVSLTRSGRTALIMSKVITPADILFFALTPERRTYNRMALYHGVQPVLLPKEVDPRSGFWDEVDDALLATGCLERGDTVVIVSGYQLSSRATNMCKIVRLGQREYY